MRDRKWQFLPAVLCLATFGGALGLEGQDSPEDLAARYRAYQAVVREAAVAIEREQYAVAIDACTRAIAMSPFTASHYFYRGLARYKLGNQQEAIGDFSRALALDPRLASAYLYRGLSRVARSEYEPALQDYTAALGLNQDDAIAQNDLAWLYATARDGKFRDPVKALEHARKAAQLSKEKNAEILDTLAKALFVNGKIKEAQDTEKKALNLDPGNKTFQENLGTYRRTK
jgi:tetratricopeptide (TPR) repeat protein